MTLKGNGTDLLLTHRKYKKRNIKDHCFTVVYLFLKLIWKLLISASSMTWMHFRRFYCKFCTQLVQINNYMLLTHGTEVSAVHIFVLWIMYALSFISLYRSFPNNYWDKFVKRKASRIFFFFVYHYLWHLNSLIIDSISILFHCSVNTVTAIYIYICVKHETNPFLCVMDTVIL